MAVMFCVGTGRCGTTFLSEVAGREPEVAASHERLRRAATFHLYCKWNGLQVDPEGFLVDREAAVREDLREHRVSFESSALLSHSIAELHARFDARFVMLVRRPDHTVASFAVRGWFLQPIARSDARLPPTLRDAEEPRHFFGRNLPHGAEFDRWSALTQIGKLAWFWTARNRAIVEQLRHLPASHRCIVRLEDLDADRYRELARFGGWSSTVTDEAFAQLRGTKPNAGPNPPRLPATWTSEEAAQFEAEVGPLASALGYEHRVERLVQGVDPRLPHVPSSLEAPDVWGRLTGG
ncbi:MAG: sulfotransferase [Myxococcales bacterium]|nr:sulfotransferase [Myxococcales bacterium]